MGQRLARFIADEEGATAIEYALIASLIAVVIVGAVTALGTRVGAMFALISASFPAAAP